MSLTATLDTGTWFDAMEKVVALTTAELNGIDVDLGEILGDVPVSTVAAVAVRNLALMLCAWPEPVADDILARWGITVATRGEAAL